MARSLRLFAVLVLVVVGVLAVPSHLVYHVEAVCTTKCAPPPPPPPTVGQFGGPLAGLTSSETGFFNGGYGLFAIKWDPIRGLGPVSTRTGCFTCHGAGVDVLTGTAGDTSNITGTRYGKWNPDNTFNYLDGNGTFPENEGGPILHGVSNSTFGTLPHCNIMNIAPSPNGATESGTTVTITTNAAHGFSVGQMAQIESVGVSGYNGNFPIVSVPSTTTFTYTVTTSNLTSSGGGTAKNLPHEVIPTDATVVNLVRSPQLFGLGLIDNISDADITANACTGGIACKAFGIAGVANMVPDENGVIRPGKFGQKLNEVSLFQFNAHAEFNELGITTNSGPFGIPAQFNPNEHLPQGLAYPSACQPDQNAPQDVAQTNMIKMSQFIALLAPIPPQPPTTQTQAGFTVFNNIGCSVCHIVNFTTRSNVTLNQTMGRQTKVVNSLSNITFTPYSDFLLHDMGSGESGGIPFQPNGTGQATLTMWRTAPLWGLSNILAKSGGLMHDNTSTSTDAAIRRHGGEAATVLSNYEALSPMDQGNLLAFLNSL